jgi:Lsr2
MTKKIHVHLIDDLDASEASETLRFEVDGRPYEIDLSSHNARRFRAEIAPYIERARRVITPGRRGRAGAGVGPPRGRARAAARGDARPASDLAADEGGVMAADEASPPHRPDLGTAALDGRPVGPDSGDEERPPS